MCFPSFVHLNSIAKTILNTFCIVRATFSLSAAAFFDCGSMRCRWQQRRYNEQSQSNHYHRRHDCVLLLVLVALAGLFLCDRLHCVSTIAAAIVMHQGFFRIYSPFGFVRLVGWLVGWLAGWLASCYLCMYEYTSSGKCVSFALIA